MLRRREREHVRRGSRHSEHHRQTRLHSFCCRLGEPSRKLNGEETRTEFGNLVDFYESSSLAHGKS